MNEKLNKKTELHIQEFGGNFRSCIKCVIGIPGGVKERMDQKKIFEVIVPENCLKLMTSTKPHIEEILAGEHQIG